MPTPTKGARLGGSPAHQRLMLANLATSLFEHGRITTTEAKARRLRPYAEKLITKARKADLHNRREVMRAIRDKDIVHKLFAEIGPSFLGRDGGYTRIIKTMPRKGDNAPMAVIELVTGRTVSAEAEQARGTRFARDEKAAPAATEAPATTVDADETAQALAATEASDASTSPAATTDVEESASTDEAPHGDGSHAPLADGGQPEGFPVKGNEDSKLYHLPGTSHYDRTIAEVWFADAESAEAAGFELPKSQRPSEDES